MRAYKNITNVGEENKEKNYSDKINFSLKFCEKQLRNALQICENEPNLIINRNVIDRLSRLTLHNKMNLNYIIGDIYISLMNKEVLFDYDDEEFEINDLLIFINKVIQFKDVMNNTNIGITYNISLKTFLFKITQLFDLDEDQLNGIKLVLEEDKEINHNNILKSSFEDLITSLKEELQQQPNIYEQYKIFNQNKLSIIKLIDNCDLKDRNNYDNYLQLGKYLAFLFYNKIFSLYLQRNKNKDNEENEEVDGIKYLIYDGYENKGEMNVINSEKFYIYEDNRVNEFREKLCEIILKYVETFLKITDTFQMQYIIYVLIKRAYFYHSEKNKKNRCIIS